MWGWGPSLHFFRVDPNTPKRDLETRSPRLFGLSGRGASPAGECGSCGAEASLCRWGGVCARTGLELGTRVLLLTAQLTVQPLSISEAAQRCHALQDIRIQLSIGRQAPHGYPAAGGWLQTGVRLMLSAPGVGMIVHPDSGSWAQPAPSDLGSRSSLLPQDTEAKPPGRCLAGTQASSLGFFLPLPPLGTQKSKCPLLTGTKDVSEFAPAVGRV